MAAAALALLDEGGLTAVTIAAVSNRSGHSNGSLYHRFGNRIGLIGAVQAQLLDRIEAESAAAFHKATEDLDDRAAVERIVGTYVAIFSHHRRALRALMIEGQDVEPLRTRGQETSHRIQQWAVEWFSTRFDCSTARAGEAVFVTLSSAMNRVFFDDEMLMHRPLDDADLVAALVTTVLALVTD